MPSSVAGTLQSPFAFTGTLEKIVVDVSGELIEDKGAERRTVMAHQ
jgi:arylsulfatase